MEGRLFGCPIRTSLRCANAQARQAAGTLAIFGAIEIKPQEWICWSKRLVCGTDQFWKVIYFLPKQLASYLRKSYYLSFLRQVRKTLNRSIGSLKDLLTRAVLNRSTRFAVRWAIHAVKTLYSQRTIRKLFKQCHVVSYIR